MARSGKRWMHTEMTELIYPRGRKDKLKMDGIFGGQGENHVKYILKNVITCNLS